mmetsp:Transcript_16238/g.35787  ORF Transcript_16238/g.35787 Transcript_16238/m.35787 type:complete len:227 (+) Transcript_16238:743-1423(+)
MMAAKDQDAHGWRDLCHPCPTALPSFARDEHQQFELEDQVLDRAIRPLSARTESSSFRPPTSPWGHRLHQHRTHGRSCRTRPKYATPQRAQNHLSATGEVGLQAPDPHLAPSLPLPRKLLPDLQAVQGKLEFRTPAVVASPHSAPALEKTNRVSPGLRRHRRTARRRSSLSWGYPQAHGPQFVAEHAFHQSSGEGDALHLVQQTTTLLLWKAVRLCQQRHRVPVWR